MCSSFHIDGIRSVRVHCNRSTYSILYILQVENWREGKIQSQKNTVLILLLLLLLLPFPIPAAVAFRSSVFALWIINIKYWRLIIFLRKLFQYSFFHLLCFSFRSALLQFDFADDSIWYSDFLSCKSISICCHLFVQLNEQKHYSVRVPWRCSCVCRNSFVLIFIVLSVLLLGSLFLACCCRFVSFYSSLVFGTSKIQTTFQLIIQMRIVKI